MVNSRRVNDRHAWLHGIYVVPLLRSDMPRPLVNDLPVGVLMGGVIGVSLVIAHIENSARTFVRMRHRIRHCIGNLRLKGNGFMNCHAEDEKPAS
jgi:hypothetical protein